MNEDYDIVLVYRNGEGLLEEVYKSESPKLYQELISSEGKVVYAETFREQLRYSAERRIELMLWKLNLKSEDEISRLQLEDSRSQLEDELNEWNYRNFGV